MSTEPGCRTRVESFENLIYVPICILCINALARGRSFFTVFKYLVQTFPQFVTSNILVFVA